MKYSFVITYFKRAELLNNTLVSFKHFYGARNDYEILILEDKKNVLDTIEHEALLNVLGRFELPIVHKELEFDNYSCPCSAMNYGVDIANGQYIILTNPECMHSVDILKGFDEEFGKNPNVYIVASCLNIVKCTKEIENFSDFKYAAREWYQLSGGKHNRCLNWCTSLSKVNYMDIGGFNEEYDKGLGRADVVFAKMVQQKLPFVLRDDLISWHQSHGREHQKPNHSKLVSNNYTCRIFTSRFKK